MGWRASEGKAPASSPPTLRISSSRARSATTSTILSDAMAATAYGPGSERSLKLLSVVAPMLNEEEVVERFYARVCTALEGVSFELVIVDDGSTDRTPEVLDRLASTDPRVRVIYLSRSFGHQTASDVYKRQR